RAGVLVAGVGHIRAFTAFVALFSASTLTYAVDSHPLLWTALRFIDGLCIAGVYICLESWLNERAETQARGSVLAGYMMAIYIGQAIGQFLLNLSDAAPSLPFLVASILISLSAIPVALTRITAPPHHGSATLRVAELYAKSPLAIV